MNRFLRDSLTIAGVPTAVGAVVLGLYVLPTYSRAAEARQEAARLTKATDEYIQQRAELDRLSREVNSMRACVHTECRGVPSGQDGSRLVDSVTRPINGHTLLDQTLRVGNTESCPAAPEGTTLLQREIKIESLGSFESAFEVLHAIDLDRNLNRIKSVSMTRGTQSNGLNATIVVNEYFMPSEAP